jgi:predicted nucleotidyltransferase
VSDPSPLLDRAGIEEAFRRLGERLAKRGVVADLYVFGGAAMALAYDSRRATRDVDALFKPHGIVLEEALAVAAELGLPRWWLNEQASSYVAPGGDPAASRAFDHPGLRVFAASPEHLLAMKAFAARPRDAEDIRQLTQLLGPAQRRRRPRISKRNLSGRRPPARLRLLLEDIFSDQGNLSTLALPRSLKARPRRTCPEPPQRPFIRRMRVDDLVLTPGAAYLPCIRRNQRRSPRPAESCSLIPEWMAEAKPRPATRHCPRPFIRCFRGNHRNRKLVGSDPVPAPMALRLPCPYATAPDSSPARSPHKPQRRLACLPRQLLHERLDVGVRPRCRD